MSLPNTTDEAARHGVGPLRQDGLVGIGEDRRGCQDVRYCSKECQLAAWPGHKAACKARVKEREEKTRVKIIDP